MNKLEAKQKLHNIVFAKMNTRPDDLKLADVMQVIDRIAEPQKVVVPKFVAEWIEYCKESNLTLMGSFEPVSEHGIGLAETFKGNVLNCTFWASHNQEIFARAWLDGYEVEREKLYVVNLGKIVGLSIYLRKTDKSLYPQRNDWSTTGDIRFAERLTEQEIKQKDERLWRFVKEVE